jgi:antitoxin Phd
MINPQWSLQEAKNKFSAVVDAAKSGQPQIVTRRGIPAAVVLSFEEFTKYQQLATMQLPSFTDYLLSMPCDDGEFERLEVVPREFE